MEKWIKLTELIAAHMTHGPCGAEKPTAPCMKDVGAAPKNFRATLLMCAVPLFSVFAGSATKSEQVGARIQLCLLLGCAPVLGEKVIICTFE